MGDGVKETLCTRCQHNWVCKYKEEYLTDLKTIDGHMKGSRFSYELKCSDFMEKIEVCLRGI